MRTLDSFAQNKLMHLQDICNSHKGLHKSKNYKKTCNPTQKSTTLGGHSKANTGIFCEMMA